MDVGHVKTCQDIRRIQDEVSQTGHGINRKSAGYSQLEPEPRMPHLGPGKAAGGIWCFKQHMLLNLLNLLVYGGPRP